MKDALTGKRGETCPRIKLCGLTRPEDIRSANKLLPEYAGFVFAKGSRRYVAPDAAAELKSLLDHRILVVGVFLDSELSQVANLLSSGVIDIAQLHGTEDAAYIKEVKARTKKLVIKAFRLRPKKEGTAEEEKAYALRMLHDAEESLADHILLDSGEGSGTVFDWQLLSGFRRPYFLAGGLTPENVTEAVKRTMPFALDVSSGIETDGKKDPAKMKAFVEAVRQSFL